MIPEDTILGDHRFASASDITRLLEQIQGLCNTMQAVVASMNSHETRITVLEVKQSMSNKEVDEIKDNGQKTLLVLAEHTKQEDKDRTRLLVAVVTTLLSVIGGITFLVFPYFVK